MKETFSVEQNIFPSKHSDFKKISHDINNIFSQYNYSKEVVPPQGFKIHISCTLNNHKKILDIINDYARNNNISFKFIHNLDVLKYSLSTHTDRSSSGKFITLYPESDQRFKQIVEELYDKLSEFKGPYILSDKQYKDSVIFYRYGLFTNDGTKNEITGPDGVKYKDERLPYYKVPSFVKEPFLVKEDEHELVYINKTYKIHGVILHRNKGGIYLAKNSEQEEVILKEARPFIGENDEAIYYKKNEADFLNRFGRLPYFPKYKGEFYEGTHFFLVESLIRGKTIEDIRSTESINKKSYSKNKTRVLSVLKAIVDFQKENIFIGDISDTNVLFDQLNDVYFIDLEQSSTLNSMGNKEYLLRTNGFYDLTIDQFNFKEQEKHQIGYALLSMFSKSNYFLILNPSGDNTLKILLKEYVNTPYFDELLNVILTLIKFPNINIEKLICYLEEGNPFEHLKEINNMKQQIVTSTNNLQDTYYKIYNTLKKNVGLNKYFFSNPNKVFENDVFYGKRGINLVFEGKIKNLEEAIIYSNYTDLLLTDKDYSLINGYPGLYIQYSLLKVSDE